MANRLAFLNQKPPSNYVPGLGRGATGFSTGADLGSISEGPSDDIIQAQLEAQRAGQTDDRYQDPENETALFANAPYDQEDEEADKIYDMIEDNMMHRRKLRQEAQSTEEMRRDKNGTVLPPIAAQFSELKRGLSTVTDDEWANLPEVGDLTRKHKRQKLLQKEQRFYAVPDSVIAGAQNSVEYESSIETNGTQTGTTTDFIELSQARDKVLGIKLDQASLKAGTTTSIDPKGYLTGLESQVLQTSAEIGDVKKARLLLNSVTQTNPKHAPGWIAAARLEEVAGRQLQARQLAAKGCENCPRNEDIWLESARLNGTDNAKRILAQAVEYVPMSVKVWTQAMNLETENMKKKRIMRKALEIIPLSVKLWKEAVNLEENPSDAKLLLARATELIPQSTELWLALARLETYENARKVLNTARKTVRTSYEIWVAAARLEEQQGNIERVTVIIDRAFVELQQFGGMLTRERWIQEAERNEEDGGILTAQAIMTTCLPLNVDEEDLLDTFMDDAEGAINRDRPECARAVFAYALKENPEEADIWQKAAQFEHSIGRRDNFFEVLGKAVKACPEAEVLWLMYAKEKWLAGELFAARDILASSFEYNPNSEDIWLAAVKLEVENREMDRAKQYLKRARHEAGTERIWIRAAVLERQTKCFDAALELVNEGLSMFPNSPKLWLVKAQTLIAMESISAAREAYSAGLRNCKESVALWIDAAKLEEIDGKIVRARALFDRARLANKASEILWYHSITLELRNGHLNQAKPLLAKALQECPTSGMLWAEQIQLEPKNARIGKATDALHKCETDPYLVCAVGRIFWSQRKFEKASNWFTKAIKANNDIGDVWAWFYKFLNSLEDAKEEQKSKIDSLMEEMEKADPKHGVLWPAVNKADENLKKSLREKIEILASGLVLQ